MASEGVGTTQSPALRPRTWGLASPSRLGVTYRWLKRHKMLLLATVPVLVYALIVVVMGQLGIVSWDAPAHLYKVALLGEKEAVFWDNHWYGGGYDLISYGLLFYAVAQVVPYVVLVVLSAGALPFLLHLYLRRAWPGTGYLPAVALAFVLTVYLANGQDPFLFAMALMLGGMVLLASGHTVLAVFPMAGSIFAHPLALVIGGVFLLAEFIARPGVRRAYLRSLLYLSPFLLVRVLFAIVFWEKGSYVYAPGHVLLFVGYGAIGYLLTRLSRDPERSAKGALFLTFTAVALVFALIPGNPVGFNIGRFFFLFAVPLLLSVRRLLLPGAVTAVLLVAVSCGQMIPPASHYVHVADLRSTRAEFFVPALSFAATHYEPGYRFHVVALDTHWEAYYFSVNDFPITRGWYRQADAVHNRILSSEFTAESYVAWLKGMGVKYIFLPHAPLDWSGERESEILRTSPEIAPVTADADWTIFRLRDPQPIAVALHGGQDPEILALLHQAVYLRIPAAGDYLIKATYSPYWQITAGAGTLAKAPGDESFLLLRAAQGGLYGVSVRVTLEASLRELVRLF